MKRVKIDIKNYLSSSICFSKMTDNFHENHRVICGDESLELVELFWKSVCADEKKDDSKHYLIVILVRLEKLLSLHGN